MTIHTSTFYGKVESDPEVSPGTTQDIVQFTLAVDCFPYVFKKDSKKTSYIEIVIPQRKEPNLFELCKSYIKKGQTVLVHGEMISDYWEGASGERRHCIKLFAQEVRIIELKEKTGEK